MDDTASSDALDFRGVRTHNLKGIDVRIPHGQLVAITGPSGSGKSSLAFDTIFAEGRRQFLNSLSLRARQAFQFLPRPDVEKATGIQPVVCIDQQKSRPNSRSTVSTVCEIEDRLRLLMARCGSVYCSDCGTEIVQVSRAEIEYRILQFPERTKVVILAPFELNSDADQSDDPKKRLRGALGEIRKAGFVRVRIDDEIHDLENLDPENLPSVSALEAVVDRLIVKPGVEGRLGESIGQALKLGEGILSLLVLEPSDSANWVHQRWSTSFDCSACKVSYDEIDTRTFNFNSPFGACQNCQGQGRIEGFSQTAIFYPPDCSLAKLPIWECLPKTSKQKIWRELKGIAESCGIQQTTRCSDIDAESQQKLFQGGESGHGLQILLEKEFVTTTDPARLDLLEDYRDQVACPECKGSRLAAAARNVRIGEYSLPELTSMSVIEAIDHFSGEYGLQSSEKFEIASPIIRDVLERLRFLEQVGVGYLTLNRRADSLSGGELQRVRLANGIGAGLSGTCFILDEPTVGLHPHDNQRLLSTMRRIQSMGNTLIVVEHDEEVIRSADRLIDIGPGAGRAGGEIVAEGKPDEVVDVAQSATGKMLGQKKLWPSQRQPAGDHEPATMRLSGARLHNLKQVNLEIPLGRLVCITGVSGSGKSSLIHGTLIPALQNRLGRNRWCGPHDKLEGVERIDRVVEIDQQPIGRSSRSNAATFSGMFDEIRKLFAQTREAKQRGYSASRFSFNNRDGACAECRGHGRKKIELSFMPDLHVTCEACQGARFNQSTLQAKFKGYSIDQVLDLAVDDAAELFSNVHKIHRFLTAMQEVGLGYLRIGQPATSLSGGEAQRLKIATHLAVPPLGHSLFVFDEPTSGLHWIDVQRLYGVLDRLVSNGNTVVVIEHNLDMIRHADYVIDMGPGGGQRGGEIVAAGNPSELAADPQSVTGQYLKSRIE